MRSKGGHVFCPTGVLWLKIDGSGSARSTSDRPWLFAKSSEEGGPKEGSIVGLEG